MTTFTPEQEARLREIVREEANSLGDQITATPSAINLGELLRPLAQQAALRHLPKTDQPEGGRLAG
jgi:cytochrome P450